MRNIVKHCIFLTVFAYFTVFAFNNRIFTFNIKNLQLQGNIKKALLSFADRNAFLFSDYILCFCYFVILFILM